MDYLSIILGFLGGGGVASIVVACLNRKWAKNDKRGSELTAVVNGLKIIMLDRVRWLGKQHLREGHISLEDKETLIEMHKAYKSLGGNGHLDPVMEEVERLRIE